MTFDDAVKIVFDEEGPLSYDTADGLPTKWGIRAAFYPQVAQDSFTQDDAKTIYKTDYWDKVQCDKFPAWLRFILFECAVNQGQVTAVRALQTALKVRVDGWVGPVTIQAATNAGMNGLAAFAVRRAQLYTEDRKYALEGHGWLERLERDVIRSAKFLTLG
jgi:lysozyme family protein